MRLYFSEKIQMTIMKKRTIELVQEQALSQSKATKKSSGGAGSASEDPGSRMATNQSNIDSESEKSKKGSEKMDSSSDDDSEEENFDIVPLANRPLKASHMKAAMNKIKRERKLSLTTMRQGRSKRLVYTMKIENQKNEREFRDVGGVINDFVSASQKNDELVKMNLSSQMDAIQKRILERSKLKGNHSALIEGGKAENRNKNELIVNRANANSAATTPKGTNHHMKSFEFKSRRLGNRNATLLSPFELVLIREKRPDHFKEFRKQN